MTIDHRGQRKAGRDLWRDMLVGERVAERKAKDRSTQIQQQLAIARRKRTLWARARAAIRRYMAAI